MVEARPYDAVYDPVYTVADGRDYARSVQRGTATAMEAVPTADHVFEAGHGPTMYRPTANATRRLPPRERAIFRPQKANAADANGMFAFFFFFFFFFFLQDIVVVSLAFRGSTLVWHLEWLSGATR